MKPCMMTWPDMVPTVDDDKPDASSDTAKTQLDALPRSGARVLWASSMVPTVVRPFSKKVAAAMISIAALTRPATPMASVTSRHSNRNSRRSWTGSRTTMRPWVRAECRKMTWGMTVAPRMPVARSTLSVPWKCGTTAW